MSRVRVLSDPDHLPALYPAFVIDRPALGLGDDHRAVHELRELSMWSEGQVWCSPERHGTISGIMKAQIDHLPLKLKGMRPTQGRTLAVMQVSGGSQSFNAVNMLRLQGRSAAAAMAKIIPHRFFMFVISAWRLAIEVRN